MAAAKNPGNGMQAPPASSSLARVIYTAARGFEDAKILSLGPRGAAMALGKKATLILFAWEESSTPGLAERLTEVMKQRFDSRLVVGLVGGGDRAREVLENARPKMTQVKVGQIHFADSGQVWSRDVGPAKKLVSDFEKFPAPSAEEWASLLVRTAADQADFADKQKEAQEFFTALGSRQPIATWTLAGILLAVFGLEHFFGGTQSPPVLIRMGALSPERVLEGEIWRIFSCTFLHSGTLHVAFNTYVLWVLGTSLERILGTCRFLVLYGLSCLGASLVSLAFLDGFSVGASGGVWGLLGAEAVLAWRSQGLLPRAMIPGARRAAAINLGINVLNSFRPHVDMWAHFGGGAVGAGLLVSGLLTRGVPRLGELEAEGRLEGAEAATIRTGPPWKAAAAVSALVLLLGLVLGLVNGRPWDLQRPVASVRTPIPELGISLELPSGLKQRPGLDDATPSVEVGDLRSDPGAVALTVFTVTPAEEQAALATQLAQAPQGGSVVAGPEEVTFAGAPGLTVTYGYPSGMEVEMALVFLPEATLRADSRRWPAFGDAVPRGYVAQVLESLERE